jgi:hypothetical protein
MPIEHSLCGLHCGKRKKKPSYFLNACQLVRVRIKIRSGEGMVLNSDKIWPKRFGTRHLISVRTFRGPYMVSSSKSKSLKR